MSGGVDSSVTASLLKNKGYHVQGFFMALAQPDLGQQIERVKKVAEHLNVSLTVIDLADAFRETRKAVISWPPAIMPGFLKIQTRSSIS